MQADHVAVRSSSPGNLTEDLLQQLASSIASGHTWAGRVRCNVDFSKNALYYVSPILQRKRASYLGNVYSRRADTIADTSAGYKRASFIEHNNLQSRVRDYEHTIRGNSTAAPATS